MNLDKLKHYYCPMCWTEMKLSRNTIYAYCHKCKECQRVVAVVGGPSEHDPDETGFERAR